jgi:hypothetical protein
MIRDPIEQTGEPAGLCDRCGKLGYLGIGRASVFGDEYWCEDCRQSRNPRMNEQRETKLRAEIARLRAALMFYADIETYRGHGMQDAAIIHDGGQIARRALEEK